MGGAGQVRHRLRLLAGVPAGWSVSHLENDGAAPLTTLSTRAWHFAPSSGPLALSWAPPPPTAEHPTAFPCRVLMAGPLMGEAALPSTLRSPGCVRESGEPGKKDKRTLTKQPACKLMERKSKTAPSAEGMHGNGETSCCVAARLPWPRPQFLLSGRTLGFLLG